MKVCFGLKWNERPSVLGQGDKRGASVTISLNLPEPALGHREGAT